MIHVHPKRQIFESIKRDYPNTFYIFTFFSMKNVVKEILELLHKYKEHRQPGLDIGNFPFYLDNPTTDVRPTTSQQAVRLCKHLCNILPMIYIEHCQIHEIGNYFRNPDQLLSVGNIVVFSIKSTSTGPPFPDPLIQIYAFSTTKLFVAKLVCAISGCPTSTGGLVAYQAQEDGTWLKINPNVPRDRMFETQDVIASLKAGLGLILWYKIFPSSQLPIQISTLGTLPSTGRRKRSVSHENSCNPPEDKRRSIYQSLFEYTTSLLPLLSEGEVVNESMSEPIRYTEALNLNNSDWLLLNLLNLNNLPIVSGVKTIIKDLLEKIPPNPQDLDTFLISILTQPSCCGSAPSCCTLYGLFSLADDSSFRLFSNAQNGSPTSLLCNFTCPKCESPLCFSFNEPIFAIKLKSGQLSNDDGLFVLPPVEQVVPSIPRLAILQLLIVWTVRPHLIIYCDAKWFQVLGSINAQETPDLLELSDTQVVDYLRGDVVPLWLLYSFPELDNGLPPIHF